MTAEQIPEFISFWTSRYRLANNLELAKKLETALLESHRFMKLLSTIDHRWTKGNLPSGTTGGRILYRTRLNDTGHQGQKLWRYLLQLLRHSQRLALEQLGNKETEGCIDAEVEREFEGEIFFNILYDNYLFGPPAEGYDIERLVLGFESWNDNCKTWIDAADALSSKAIRETPVEYLNPRRRPHGQHTLPVSNRTRPQNSSDTSHDRLAEQTTGDIPTAVSHPNFPGLSSVGARGGDLPPMSLPVMGCSTQCPVPQSRPSILAIRQTRQPIQNLSDLNQVAPLGQATNVVPRLLPVTRAERPKIIPPRSGYFTRRPGRLGRLIQPIPQHRRASTHTHEKSSGQNLVPYPRHASAIVAPLVPAASNPRSPFAAVGASGVVVPPGYAPNIAASLLHPAPIPRSPSLVAGGASGQVPPPVQAPAMVAPAVCPAPSPGGLLPAGRASREVVTCSQAAAIVASSQTPAASPRSPSPAGGPSKKIDAPTRPPTRGRLNYKRLIREHFGVDLDLPPEERVYPEKNFVLVDGAYTLRTEQFPSLSAVGGASGEVARPRHAPTAVAPSPNLAPSPRSPSTAGEASGEIASHRPSPVDHFMSAIDIIDLDTEME